MISKYFTWNEALELPQWGRLATEADGLTEEIKSNLVKVFEKMDLISDLLDSVLVVHCAYRPPEYNKLVQGSPRSAHIDGLAVDFHVKNMSCKSALEKIIPKLEEFGIRCEDNGPMPVWIHIDLRPVGHARYFKP